MKVTFVGDIHGEWDSINAIINREKPDILIQLGDNAYWWTGKENENVGKIFPKNTKVYLLPGNHENFDVFESYLGRNSEKPIEVEPNIFYCPIGSILEVKGKNILFVGGAESIDKKYRIPKISWWEQEILKEKDYQYILQKHKNKEINIVCSHTCPEKFNVFESWDDLLKIQDLSGFVLNSILKKFKPDYWFFGHFHRHRSDIYYHFGNTKEVKTDWMCLNMTRHPSDIPQKLNKDSYFSIIIPEVNNDKI